MEPRLLQQLKGRQQADDLKDGVERHLLLGIDDGEQELGRDHLLMVRRHRHIQPRQQQRRQQRQIPQHPQAGGGDIVDRAVLRRFHQNAEIHRREIPQRQPVDKQAHLPVQKTLTEGIRPFGVLQERKGRFTRAGHIFLHARGRQHPIDIDRRQPLLHAPDERRIRQICKEADRDGRLAAKPHGLLHEAQLRRAQMAAQEARVDAHGLGKGVLRALDRVFRFRRGRAAAGIGLRLEAERRARAGKDDGAVAVQQLVRGVLRRRDPLGHGAVDPCLLRLGEHRLHAAGLHRLHERTQDLLRDIAAGRQPVEKQHVQLLPAGRDLPLRHIRAAAEQRPQLRRAPVFHPDRLPYKTLLSFFRIWRKLYLFSPVQVCISRQFVVDYSESYASADAITHI